MSAGHAPSRQVEAEVCSPSFLPPSLLWRRHVELAGGTEFPFSRGVSFYEVDEDGRIVFARDIVEPAVKPGGAALKVRAACFSAQGLGAGAPRNCQRWFPSQHELLGVTRC